MKTSGQLYSVSMHRTQQVLSQRSVAHSLTRVCIVVQKSMQSRHRFGVVAGLISVSSCYSSIAGTIGIRIGRFQLLR